MGGEAGGVGDVSPGSLDLDSKKTMGREMGGKKSKWKMVGGGREAAASQANHEKNKKIKKNKHKTSQSKKKEESVHREFEKISHLEDDELVDHFKVVAEEKVVGK